MRGRWQTRKRSGPFVMRGGRVHAQCGAFCFCDGDRSTGDPCAAGKVARGCGGREEGSAKSWDARRTMRFFTPRAALVLCLAALGCSQPQFRPAVDITVRMPFDMNTNLPGDTPLVIEIPDLQPWASVDEFTREELPSWRESMRVVRWPSREPIEGRWVFSNTLPLSFTFEPTGRLPVASCWATVMAAVGRDEARGVARDNPPSVLRHSSSIEQRPTSETRADVHLEVSKGANA